MQDVDEETALQIALAESVRTAKEEQTKRTNTAPQVSNDVWHNLKWSDLGITQNYLHTGIRK